MPPIRCTALGPSSESIKRKLISFRGRLFSKLPLAKGHIGVQESSKDFRCERVNYSEVTYMIEAQEDARFADCVAIKLVSGARSPHPHGHVAVVGAHSKLVSTLRRAWSSWGLFWDRRLIFYRMSISLYYLYSHFIIYNVYLYKCVLLVALISMSMPAAASLLLYTLQTMFPEN